MFTTAGAVSRVILCVEGGSRGGDAFAAGAYTRPLLSST